MANPDIVQAIHQLEVNLLRKLSENSTQLATHTEKLDEHCDKLDTLFDKLDRLDRTVYGVGGDQDGLATRVRIVEETEDNRKYTIRGLFIMLMGVLGKILYDLFKS